VLSSASLLAAQHRLLTLDFCFQLGGLPSGARDLLDSRHTRAARRGDPATQDTGHDAAVECSSRLNVSSTKPRQGGGRNSSLTLPPSSDPVLRTLCRRAEAPRRRTENDDMNTNRSGRQGHFVIGGAVRVAMSS